MFCGKPQTLSILHLKMNHGKMNCTFCVQPYKNSCNLLQIKNDDSAFKRSTVTLLLACFAGVAASRRAWEQFNRSTWQASNTCLILPFPVKKGSP